MPRPDTWTDLAALEPAWGLIEHSPDLSVLDSPIPWPRLAHWASTTAGGQWIPLRGGVLWVNGRRRWWLVSRSVLAATLEAREACCALGVEPGWSVGSCAGKLLSWVGPGQRHVSCDDRLLSHGTGGLIEVRPGYYQSALMCDCKEYYYTFLCMLPSLRVTPLSSGRLCWHPMEAAEWSRWREVLAAVRGCKVLRNSLWGRMLGSSYGQRFYCRGECRSSPPYYGSFSAAARLVLRSARELTWLAAREVDSVYTHTDCVCSPTMVYPSIWDTFGFQIGDRLTGAAEIHSHISYRIGDHETRWYRRGCRLESARAEVPPPDRLWHESWVRRVA